MEDAGDAMRALGELHRLDLAANGAAPFANMVLAAQLITVAALQREESRGGHYRRDFRQQDATAQHSRLSLAGLKAALTTQTQTPVDAPAEKASNAQNR